MAASIPDPIATATFVRHLRARGVNLTVHDDLLRVSAPKGVVDAVLAEQIANRKDEILGFLERPSNDAPSAIERANRSEALQLGLVQQRILLHNQVEPDTVLYNLPIAWRLTGSIDLEAFLRAYDDVVARHEVLGTSIIDIDGEPAQRFGAAAGALLVEDLSSSTGDRERELMDRLLAIRDEVFDLEKGPLLRARLFRMAHEDHVFFLMPHHLIWDGWSFQIFMRDLREFYDAATSGRQTHLPDLPIQYADYAVWHRRWLNAGALDEQLAHWTHELVGELTPLELPTDLPRPKRFNYRGDWESFDLSASAMDRISRVAGQRGGTSFMVLLSAWSAFIHRICDQQDIVVGVPIQARQSPDVSDLIGCFVNTLCMRVRVDPSSSFERMIEDVRDSSLRAYEHQDVPFDVLAERLSTRGDPSRTPLFQTMFSHQHVQRTGNIGAMSVTPIPVNPGATPTDLMLAVMEDSAGARCAIHFSTDLFYAATIRKMRARFEWFLDAAVANPATPIRDLPIVTPDDRSALALWNANARPLPIDMTLHGALRAQAERTPERVAIRFNGTTTSYRTLDERSGRIARALRSRGAQPGQLIGVCLERSPDLVATLIAVLKVGAAYVPLDPTYPPERLHFMAQDAKLALTVSEEALVDRINCPRQHLLLLDSDSREIEAAHADPVETDAAPHAPESAAYVIYTSGSTGTPKGVVVPHRAVVNFLASMQREPGLGADDRLLAITTTSFDIAVLELFGPLCVGAEVVLASREAATDGHALAALLAESDATFMQGTPASWRMLVDCGWSAPPNFKAMSGGEALAPDLAKELIARGAQVWNAYGPTETTVWSTCCRIASGDAPISIGKPIDNTTVWVLDGHGQPCPPGIYGEICIGGEGVTLGYLDRPELTAERFIEDHLSDTRPRRSETA